MTKMGPPHKILGIIMFNRYQHPHLKPQHMKITYINAKHISVNWTKTHQNYSRLVFTEQRSKNVGV